MILKQIDGNLRVNMKAREWCKLPYPNHPKGCPNYGKRLSCPPQAPLVNEYFNLQKPLYLIAVEFNLAEYISSMIKRHPEWSDRQCRCVLYWQSHVNKELRSECDTFIKSHPSMIATTCPEAMGVQVIETARRCGIAVETKPTIRVYKIAIVGLPLIEEISAKRCSQSVMRLEV